MRYLTITVRWLDGLYHGRGDGGQPEWPPSPMRLFSALVAGNAPLTGELSAALRWLERQPPPTIHAARKVVSDGVQAWVPSNNLKLVNGAASIRTGKVVRPVLPADPSVTFIWAIDDKEASPAHILAAAAGNLRCLGWGVDLAVGHGQVMSAHPTPGPTRVAFMPDQIGGNELRVPIPGSLDSLDEAYRLALARVHAKQIDDQPGITRFEKIPYRLGASGEGRRWCAFSLRDDDGELVGFLPNQLRKLAGMVRHIAADAMRDAGKEEAWIDDVVLGHDRGIAVGRISILALPTIGHSKSDGLVRRVLLRAPDSITTELLARGLHTKRLRPESARDAAIPKPTLELIRERGPLINRYVGESKAWATATPILLPGHDVRKQDKGDHRRRTARAAQLVAKALAQAGLLTPCEIEPSRLAFWPGVTSADRYEPRQKYLKYPRWHARLEFDEPIAGPLAIGAGRHVGFGVLAACDGA